MHFALALLSFAPQSQEPAPGIAAALAQAFAAPGPMLVEMAL